MKKSRFTEEQIAFALRQAEAGTKVAEVCRARNGVPDEVMFLALKELVPTYQLELPLTGETRSEKMVSTADRLRINN